MTGNSASGQGTVVGVDREGQVSRFVEDVVTSGWRSFHPVWTPDGLSLTFTMGDQENIAWRTADGTDEPEELLARESGQYPWSWSPDGQHLAFYERKATGDRDIWLIPREGDRMPTAFISSPADERAPRFSPDGNWLAYVSDESRRDEVYVRRYPGPGAQMSGGRSDESVQEAARNLLDYTEVGQGVIREELRRRSIEVADPESQKEESGEFIGAAGAPIYSNPDSVPVYDLQGHSSHMESRARSEVRALVP